MKVVPYKKGFGEIYNDMDLSSPYQSPLGEISLRIIYQFGLMANKIPGVAAEAGVFGGYSLLTLANVFDREIHAFDSWNGLPDISDQDGEFLHKGGFTASIDLVKERLSFTDKVIYHHGFFNETFPDIDKSIRFNYAFCDVDLYQSVLECFEFFYPRMNPGGVLFFDDCFCEHTPGAKIAIDEIVESHPELNVYVTGGFVVFDV